MPERFGRKNEDHVGSLEQVGVREQWKVFYAHGM